MMLIGKHATVTVCHTRTADMAAECRNGEILIVSAGRPKIVNSDYLSPGQAVIDVGINVLEDGSMCGDVDFDAAQDNVGAITPVPSGVGAVTTSVLGKYVVQAAKRAEVRCRVSIPRLRSRRTMPRQARLKTPCQPPNLF